MAERSKAHDWKSCVPVKGYREFESHSIRQHKSPAKAGLDCYRRLRFELTGSEFDKKRKAGGRMPFGEADERPSGEMK